MAIESKRLKVNQPVILLTGLAMLSASILTFLLIINSIYGDVSISKIIPSSDNFRLVFEKKDYTAAILYSKSTENMLPEGSTWVTDNIDTWKTFLSQNKVKFEVISDRDLENGKHLSHQLLILPGTKSLSDKEITQIKRFLENGGSVFATSGVASYSHDGKWRGWEFFSEVFGLNFSKEITSTEITKIHTLRGGLPLTTGIPAGYPLKIATWDRPMACEVLDPRTVQVSFWYDFRKETGLVDEEINKSAGIAYGYYGKGRFVWMGFELNSVIGQQEDYIFFDKFFKNSLSWLAYKPTVLVKDWPGDYRAAAMIVPTITSESSNANYLLSILGSERVPAVFFVDPYTIDENRGIIQRLSRYGEVGAIVDVGYLESVKDTMNKLNSYNYQLGSLRSAKYNLNKVKGIKNNGFRPLYGLYNENSIRALINAGYNYVITDSLTDRSVPKAIIRGEKTIVSFTKTARDDYEVIGKYGLTDPEFQLYTYKEDVDRLLFEGGMYMLKIHTDYQMNPAYIDVVRQLIRYMKQNKIWIATPTQIKDWWLSKSSLEISTEVRSSKRIAVEISNPGKQKVYDADVYVSLNKPVKNLRMLSDMFGVKIPKYWFDAKRSLVIIKVSNMSAGDSYQYYIDFDEL